MITEDYVSFETAKLLKEKGFDEPCLQMWECGPDKKYLFRLQSSCYQNITEEDSCLAPTHQMAMKWLREVHNKHCDIGYDIDLKWFFQIIDLKETVEYDYPETKYYHTENESGFNSYEDAVEAVLKYVFENLI